MQKRFVAAREDLTGKDWLARFVAGRDEAERWYRGHGLDRPPGAAECRAALRRHMPEILPQYDRVCTLVGDDDIAHRILSHYRPAPTASGCSHAIWLGADGPALVRNYDYRPDIVTGRFESSMWFGREIIGTAQRPWGGCLDGMNEDGLVASLSFGGSQAQGRGFSVILILRYVLETCRRVDEAVAALTRIPVALSQNVTLLDRSGDHATVFLGPDRIAAVTRERACTNHQETVNRLGRTTAIGTVERKEVIERALAVPAMTLPRLISRFFEPPLYVGQADVSTVYTAVYQPAIGRVDYMWPGKVWTQEISRFAPGEYVHDFGDLATG